MGDHFGHADMEIDAEGRGAPEATDADAGSNASLVSDRSAGA